MSKDQKRPIHIPGNIKQITILEGEAPEQFNPEAIVLKGIISAPADFIEQRADTFNPEKSHAIVEKTNGQIILVINEQSVTEKYTIRGVIQKGKKISDLGINTGKIYSPKDLSRRFRLERSLFNSATDHLTLITELRNFDATIKNKVDEEDDLRGNTKNALIREVESNIPEEFDLRLPVIEGEDEEIIEVSIMLEISGSRIFCSLESVDAEEIYENRSEELIEKEVERLKGKTTIIEK